MLRENLPLVAIRSRQSQIQSRCKIGDSVRRALIVRAQDSYYHTASHVAAKSNACEADTITDVACTNLSQCC